MHSRHAVSLLAEPGAFSHGVSLDFNCVGIIYDPIAYCVSHRRFADFKIPTGNVKLRTEDRRCPAISCLDDLKKVPRLAFFEWEKQPIIDNEELDGLVVLHNGSIGPITSGDCQFYQKIRETQILHGIEVAVSCHPQGTGKVGFTGTCRSKDDHVMVFQNVVTGR